jgi:predicted ATPase/CYTH domain-containing protein
MKQHKIVLTGGPCGGKTTAMSRIAERLEGLGFRVFTVPETPTILFQGGFSLHDVTPAQVVELETTLLRTVMNNEASFQAIAEVYGEDCVFLCDRGMMDTKAYVSADMWQTILSNLGQTEVQLRDQRYDAVVHMVTAAEGAEQFYTLANNTARTETPEQARDLDKKTQDAWVGHPHLRVVDNRADFDEKVRMAGAAACRVVGVPEPREVERRFLVASVGDIPVKNVTVDIDQRYLLTPGGSEEERVRKRGRDNSFVYTHTIKRRQGHGIAAELDRMITPAEHLMLLERRDESRAPVFKTRTCFVWEGRYFELDDPVELPPFVKIEREVTGEKAFSNREIARALVGYGARHADELRERVREEGEVSILLPSREQADLVVDALYGLTEGVSCSGKDSKTLGLPYVLTLRRVAIHD